MGLVIKTDDKGIKIFRKDKTSSAGNPYTTYCRKISSKDKDGNWVNAFQDVVFKKGVSVNNKATIVIENAFETVSSYNDKTSVKLFILDFKVIEEGEVSANIPGIVGAVVDANGFMQIDDSFGEELPFE